MLWQRAKACWGHWQCMSARGRSLPSVLHLMVGSPLWVSCPLMDRCSWATCHSLDNWCALTTHPSLSDGLTWALHHALLDSCSWSAFCWLHELCLLFLCLLPAIPPKRALSLPNLLHSSSSLFQDWDNLWGFIYIYIYIYITFIYIYIYISQGKIILVFLIGDFAAKYWVHLQNREQHFHQHEVLCAK